jgi:N-acetylneuraminic acid mutarotase
MKTIRFICILMSLLGAIGPLVLLFTALSSAIAAPAVLISNANTLNDVAKDRWRILADMGSGLGDPGVVTLNNKIHVVSGYYSPGYGYSSSQGIYDPHTNTWQYLWNFPIPRSDMVVVNIGDKIYAIGGWNVDLGGVQEYNHMYDPVLETWITMTSMITPVSGAGGIVMSDTIYIIGGYDGSTSTKQVQLYDSTNDTWSIGPPLSTARSEFKVVKLDGLIYAIGGTNEINNVEIYNPAEGEWHFGPPLPDTRYSMAAVTRQGLIYVIGGTDKWGSSYITDTMLIYDPAMGVWSVSDPMPTARRACGATVISDTIYVIGGSGEPGAGTANEAYADFEIISSTTGIVVDNPDPSQAFQPFVVSYLVTSSIDVPIGVVTVTVDQNNFICSEQLVGGMGSCEMILETPGIYTITATYGGDDFHTGSQDRESHTVIKAETTTTIIGDEPNPSFKGQPFLVTFSLSSTYGSPTGVVTVTVSNSQQSCSSEIAGGMGSCEITLETPGIYTITATYDGDDFHSGSSDSESHTVTKAETTTTIIRDEPDPSLPGQPLLVTFNLSSTYGSPTGVVTVTVSNSQQSCSSEIAGGMGSCEITLDTPGTYTITATYAGNITFAGSSDSTEHMVVNLLRFYLPINRKE